MFYVGQQLKNLPCDTEPSFVIVKITEFLGTGTKFYYVKDIDSKRIQKITEEFLYPFN